MGLFGLTGAPAVRLALLGGRAIILRWGRGDPISLFRPLHPYYD